MKSVSVGNEEEGLVISIDGSWGSGKTTFAKQWKASLNKGSDLRTGSGFIYLDAFEADALDDPFASLMAAVEEAIEATQNEEKSTSEKIQKLSENLKQASGGILGVSAKIGARAALSSLSFGLSSIIFEIAKEAGIDEKIAASHSVKDTENFATKLSQLAKKDSSNRTNRALKFKQETQNFREALGELAKAIREQEGLPLIVVIDELDRCRPPFAVSLLESARQFFDVKNVVFILLVQKAQIGEAIRNVYGNVDADRYLQKFIHVDLQLPNLGLKNSEENYHRFSRKMALSFNIWESYSSEIPNLERTDISRLVSAISHFSYCFSLSLREVERIYAAISIFSSALAGNKITKRLFSPTLLGFLACLRLSCSDFYLDFTRGESTLDPAVLQCFQVGTLGSSITTPNYSALLWVLAVSPQKEGIIGKFWPNDPSSKRKVMSDVTRLIENYGVLQWTQSAENGQSEPDIANVKALIGAYAMYLDTIRVVS